VSWLGIDLGTSVCKAAAFTADGRLIASASREYSTLRPAPGLSELDSGEVWRKTREIIAEVAAKTGCDPIRALCVSSMGEAVVPVSKDRRLLANSILSSDIRGAEYADALRRDVGEERLCG